MSITTAGLAQYSSLLSGLGTNSSFVYVAYGTGTTAESSAHTALVAETARVEADVYKASVLSPLDTLRIYATNTSAVAVTIAEVGVFDAAATGNMLSRKLISPTETAAINDIIFILVDITCKDGGYSFAS